MAEIYAESLATYEKKNHDYGNSFGDLMDEMGVIVGIAQIVHKTNRAKTLIMKGEQHVEDESLEETLMDLITYTAMTINKIREQEEVTAND
ncbi:MAG: nucleotide modification associated domain-containing protein [Aerococcus sp.]|nr:nucleotide modification associated domain-containing protein [Aerococcus sp.]